MSGALTVALVGPDHHENLALEYLAAAVARAGHRPRIVPFAGLADLPPTVRSIRRLGADVVGLSIAFQSSVDEYTALARELRCAGYSGHLTAGGHVPTFEYAALLRDVPALDSVIRHDGELALVELVGRVASGASLEGIAGLAWRGPEGVRVEPARPPVADLDSLATPLRPARARRFSGIPLGFVIGSRGCGGACSYCCIRAFARDAGGAPYRVRRVEAVADEIAELRRERSARVIFLEDDLFLLPARERALARLAALRDALLARGAGDLAFWVKARPESIDEAVVSALSELHVIHVFLGIENDAPSRLAYLGRRHGPRDNERAIALLRGAGIGVSFNLMLFDPDSTLEEVAVNLDFAERHLALPWNLCRTELYSGSELLRRMEREGRLTGDYRSYGYRMADDRAEIAFRILRVAFRERLFTVNSLNNQLISLFFAVEAHRSLAPGPDLAALEGALTELTLEAHGDTIRALRRVLDFAREPRSPADPARVRSFALELGLDLTARDLPRRAQASALTDALEARGAC